MRKRNNEIKVRLTDEELTHLDAMVERTIFSREGFIREMLAGYQIREKPEDEFTKWIMEMRRVGSLLNQVLQRSYIVGFIDVAAVKKASLDLWELEKYIYEFYAPFERRMKK